MEININLDDRITCFLSKEIAIDEEKIQKNIYDIVYTALKEKKLLVDSIFISIQSASEDEIKSINKEYRNIDKVTDVLSFPIFSRDEIIDIINEHDELKKVKAIELGDIIICINRVKEQSIEYKTGILREMLYMITHGVCHLLGYDHEKEEEKIEMRRLEETILEQIGVHSNE